MVFDETELGTPTAPDYDNWRVIMRQMERAAPYQLADAKVLSGRVSPKHLVNSVAARAGEDTTLENLAGTRSLVAQMYAATTPLSIEQTDASYHPYANAVVLNSRSPGVLVHELGHAIDMSRAPGQSNFRRSMRWNLKPTLLSEYDAWRKGQRAYREGFLGESNAGLDTDIRRYLDNTQSITTRKYPAFGTYVGSAGGALAGGGLALAGTLAAAIRAADGHSGASQATARALIRLLPLSVVGGAAAGGTAGLFAGAALGRTYAKRRARKLRQQELNKIVSKLNDPRLAKQYQETALQ